MKRGIMMIEMPIVNPIRVDKQKCIGCNQCLENCQMDVFLPNKEKGKPPIVAFPTECWYCGCCVMECPKEGAITLHHPLMNQVKWLNKSDLLKGDY